MSSILITGASGNMGRHIVDQLVQAGATVRAAGHAPAVTGGTRPLAGASRVLFGFTDPATWTSAFAGVQTMFLLRPPAISNVGRDLLPAIAAARQAGLRHVVFLSLQGAQHNRVVPHAKVESWLRSSGLGWTFVRPSFFTQNLSTTHAADIRDRDQITVPAGSGRTAFVDAVDVASVATAALLHPEDHRDRAWTVTGPEALTYAQFADIFTRVLGRPITYTRPGLLRYLRHARRTLGMPRTMAVVTAAIYTTARLVVLRHDLLAVAEVVVGKDGVAGGAGADDAGEEFLDVSEYAVKGHSGTAAFGFRRCRVRKPWAAATRVTWWCQPAHLRPS